MHNKSRKDKREWHEEKVERLFKYDLTDDQRLYVLKKLEEEYNK